jgi:hypothetical protein
VGRGQSGPATSAHPPQVSAAVRQQLTRPDADWKTLAMPKEELIQELRAAARQYGFAEKSTIRLAPPASSTSRAQSGATAPDQAGLQPAAAEPQRPPQHTEEQPPTSEAKPPREPTVGPPSHPGQAGSR